MPNEAKLLYDALLYENGHLRRTQHILKVYGLAKMLGELEKSYHPRAGKSARGGDFARYRDQILQGKVR